ncbi:MAG: rhodanese-like domain-containing protein [Pseudomonadota bacterium]
MYTNATYAGDISCHDAWDMLRSDHPAFLIDVRTRAEWAFVGVPLLTSLKSEPLLVEWQGYPNMERNPGFSDSVSKALTDKGADPETNLLFLCRSGARSQSAAMAMTEAGFRNCYNVAGGFEGPADKNGHRGTTDGWKAAGLPWAQS